MDEILAGVQNIVSGTLTKVHSQLRELGVEEDIEHIFDDAEDPFKGIGTRYLQDKYILENLGYVVCTTSVKYLLQFIRPTFYIITRLLM